MKGRSAALLIATLGSVQTLWTLTMDLYLPAFVQIQRDLDTSAALVQVTLTVAFVGMALGQLVTGPVSDAVGRRRPLLAVLLLSVVGSGASALAPTVEVLIAARFVQGMAAAACGVIVLAVVRDHFEGAEMVRALARLAAINGVAIVLAPSLGAVLLYVMDWRGQFWCLAAYGLVLVVVVGLALAESRVWVARERGRLAADYRTLARDGGFRAAVVTGGLVWVGMFSYLAASAFLFQEVYGLDPGQYAIVFASHGALMIVGSQLSARWSRRIDPARIATLATIGTAASAVLLLASVALLPQWGFWSLLVPLWFFTLALGVFNPANQALALAPHGERSGTAASLLGAVNMGFGALVSPVAGLLGVGTAVPTAVVMVVAQLAALAAGALLRGRGGAR
ncbi:DHA1 family bicyclomycin/chloramphenicol resistance-like MFS transporter [Diaminobutyricimonas aerilata]|uniref:DHA1 family bicyclomycin/chloramphenicol resistance-like MFS transporter n=1 Tax=Diaminobutyricimonas aerilata TaxID=1162967 RepID=A0A2M9CFQ5_9MICO|nr:multidrug effflux MFS transporter [Diaminobutyricimonas aerilata]PJJ70680.1 DHA1 family bicyclomycin/chloramphenicol resistance-like MFS transporter [Diaminobutyricimonas aerilata]